MRNSSRLGSNTNDTKAEKRRCSRPWVKNPSQKGGTAASSTLEGRIEFGICEG